MEKIDLTKLTESELRELSTKIGKEIITRNNFRKDELSRAIIQSIRAYTHEFGDLKVEIVNSDYFYFSDEDTYDFCPDDDTLVIS